MHSPGSRLVRVSCCFALYEMTMMAPSPPPSSKLKLCAAAELTECTSAAAAAPCCQNFPSFSRLWLEELVVGAAKRVGTHNHKQGHVSYQEGVQFNHRFPSASPALPVTAATAGGAAVGAVGGRTDPANGDLIVISAKEERSLFSPGAKEECEKGGKGAIEKSKGNFRTG